MILVSNFAGCALAASRDAIEGFRANYPDCDHSHTLLALVHGANALLLTEEFDAIGPSLESLLQVSSDNRTSWQARKLDRLSQDMRSSRAPRGLADELGDLADRFKTGMYIAA